MTAAFASWAAGNVLRGAATGMHTDQVADFFEAYFAEFQVPPGRVEQWAEAINGVTLGPAETPPPEDFNGIRLSDYQLAVADRGTIAGQVDGSDCGVGKTAAAVYSAFRLAKRAGNTSRCWIISTLTAHAAWTQPKGHLTMPWVEYLGAVFKEVRVISVDSAHKFIGAANIGGVVIFDEAHLMGATSRRMKACHKIRQAFDSGLCLTGTLLHASVEHALSIMDLAVPGISLFSTRWSAGEHFSCLVKKALGSRTVTALEKPSGSNKTRFQEWLSRCTIMLSMQSPEVRAEMQLPDQHLYECRIGEPWPKLTDEIARIAMEIYDETGELPHMQKVAHILCRQGIEAKLDELLGEMGSEATVVFAHYRPSLDSAGARLEREGITFVRVDGDVTGSLRLDAQRRFQAGEVQVFLGQAHAAGISLDLFRARYSASLDHSWSASDYTQLLARVARRGQEHETHHFDFVSNQLQRRVVERLRQARDFNAECSEWQDGKRAIASLGLVARGSGEIPGARGDGVPSRLPRSEAPADRNARRSDDSGRASPLETPRSAGKAVTRLNLGLPVKADIE